MKTEIKVGAINAIMERLTKSLEEVIEDFDVEGEKQIREFLNTNASQEVLEEINKFLRKRNW